MQIYESLKIEPTEIGSFLEEDVSDVKPLELNVIPVIEEKKVKKKQLKCQNCGEKVDDEDLLKQHVDTNRCHTRKKCEICNILFSSKKCLKRHYTSSNHILKTRGIKTDGYPHVRIRLYSCDRCPKSYSRADHLKDHLRIHESINGKYQCDICLKCFDLKCVLRDHIILQHVTNNKALCNFCGKAFQSTANLQQHILRHTQTKAFQCTTCQKSFISKGELNSHIRTHTGARPFVCNICGTAFTVSYSLKKHKRKHSGERPYVCTYCNKGFKILETLKIHTRIHTGEKPYSCSFCQRAFTQVSSSWKLVIKKVERAKHKKKINNFRKMTWSNMKEYTGMNDFTVARCVGKGLLDIFFSNFYIFH